MKKSVKILLSILGLSTLAFAGAGCSAGDDIKKGIDQLFCKHEYSEFVETKAPTCEEDGSQERTCSKCDKVDVEKITALGHEYSEYTETKAPSCHEKGSKERVCGVCEHVDVQEIATLDHTPGEFFGQKAPTCTEVGYFPGQKCANEDCGAVIVAPEEIPALGHDEFDIHGVKATCFEDGYTDGVGCHTCGNIVSGHEVIKALNKHTWTTHKDVAPTCVSSGTQGGFICEVCGVMDGVVQLPAIEHNYVDGVCTHCEQSKETLTAVKSMSGTNVLTQQENGTYTYTFLSIGDYVRNSEITLEKGETLVADFAVATDYVSSVGWFAVAFGNGEDFEAFPSTMFAMRMYDKFGARYYKDESVVSEDLGKTLDTVILPNGVANNYRVSLTRNEDDTYSYRLLRSNGQSYYTVDEYLNFECPSPTALYLTSYHNPAEDDVGNKFTLFNLSFYKLV